MQVKCIHEVYFEPKMFQTIGFHHQGRYNISASLYSINEVTKQKTYGYPITYMKNTGMHQAKQRNQSTKIGDRNFQYNSSKFDVSFNEQQFFFNTSSRFKLQIPHSHLQNLQQNSASNEVSSEYNEGKNKRKNPLYLLIALTKYNEQDNSGNPSLDQRGMSSTQNIIKNTIEDNIKQVQQTKIKKKRSKQSEDKKKKINEVEKVNEVILQIDTSISQDEKQNVRSIYQQILMPEQHYFGKLYFLISHIQIGYRIRPKNYTIFEFNPLRNSIITETSTVFNRSNRLRNNGKRVSSIQIIKTDKQKQPEEQKIRLSSVLEAIYNSISDQFQQLIRKQIIELNRIEKISNYLITSGEQQTIKNPYKTSKILESTCANPSLASTKSSSSNRNSYINLQGIKYLDLKVSICVPDRITEKESLFQYYECENTEQLHQILYEQHDKLSHLIQFKWHNIISMLSQKQWNSFYYFQTIINFRQTCEYLMEKKVHHQLITKGRNGRQKEQELKKIKFIPCLKYKFYVYQHIPDLYMRKSMKATQQPHTIISSEHILFILVHGFNGNQHDMNRIKSFVSYFSTPHFLVLKNISDNILESLDSIGKIAAQEILSYLKPRPFIHRINFVGFSLGGVIIRACLPYLKQYYRIFNMFMTLSSPHLGVKQVNNCIVKTGLKLLNRVKGVKNIKQLMLDFIKNQNGAQNIEGKDPNEEQFPIEQISYLQKLALHPSIGVFRLIVFCGSLDDKYVPGYSSTLDYQGSNQKIISMQENLKMNIVNLHQIYVKFNQKKKGTLWDQVTGRRVHINFLDDDSFLHFLIGQYFHLF